MVTANANGGLVFKARIDPIRKLVPLLLKLDESVLGSLFRNIVGRLSERERLTHSLYRLLILFEEFLQVSRF